MKLSIFTTITNPDIRGDNVYDAFSCYGELADEVVIVDSGKLSKWKQATVGGLSLYKSKDKIVEGDWPTEFSWPVIGQNFQRGYEACTGDWVIHADLDFLFHEQDFDNIREVCMNYNDQPAFSLLKRQFILPDRFNLKSRLVVAVNKGKFGDRIKFNSGGDLCQPSLDGQYIKPGSVPDVKIPIWNYEKLIKTKTQIMDDVGRMERAYKRHFGETQYKSDGTNEDAYKKWYEAQIGKLNKPSELVKLEDHPKYIQQTIKNLEPDQFGHSMFGHQENNYVKG